MPLPLLPLIAAGSSILGQGMQAFSQGQMNRKTRDFSREMYDRQRADSLTDWNMMNAYNSPEEQMKRFREAGLNPNLIYGQQNQGAVVRSSNVPSWSPQALPIGDILPKGVQGFMDMSLKKQTINNMERQNKVLEMQAIKIAADIANSAIRTASGEFKLGQDKALYDTVIQTANEKLSKLTHEERITHYRADILQNTAELTIKEANQRLLNMITANAKNEAERSRINAQIAIMEKDGKLKDFEISLNRDGVTKGDAVWLRAILVFLKKFGISF